VLNNQTVGVQITFLLVANQNAFEFVGLLLLALNEGLFNALVESDVFREPDDCKAINWVILDHQLIRFLQVFTVICEMGNLKLRNCDFKSGSFFLFHTHARLVGSCRFH
jgi:hypothetical protein